MVFFFSSSQISDDSLRCTDIHTHILVFVKNTRLSKGPVFFFQGVERRLRQRSLFVLSSRQFIEKEP